MHVAAFAKFPFKSEALLGSRSRIHIFLHIWFCRQPAVLISSSLGLDKNTARIAGTEVYQSER